MKYKKTLNNTPTFKTSRDDSEEEYISHESSLGYFVKSEVSNQFTVNLDEIIGEAKYYRGVVSMLMEASENDEILFLINSPGGRFNGLVALLEGIKMTDATTTAVIVGECHSAASIFALHCDQVFVSDSAEMLCHSVSFGASGKGSDILSHVQHVSKISEKLLRTTYKYFLTEKEIDEMLNGREIYLDSNEIKERLDNKEEHMKVEQELTEQKALELTENPDSLVGILEEPEEYNKPKRKK